LPATTGTSPPGQRLQQPQRPPSGNQATIAKSTGKPASEPPPPAPPMAGDYRSMTVTFVVPGTGTQYSVGPPGASTSYSTTDLPSRTPEEEVPVQPPGKDRFGNGPQVRLTAGAVTAIQNALLYTTTTTTTASVGGVPAGSSFTDLPPEPEPAQWEPPQPEPVPPVSESGRVVLGSSFPEIVNPDWTGVDY
jgi:hypothetical protein